MLPPPTLATRLLLGCLAWLLTTGSPGRAEDTPSLDFQRDVAPVLQSRCAHCHGPQKQEARLRLDKLSTDLIGDRAAAEHWHEVLNVLNRGEMPPEDEPQLTDAERAAVTGWLTAAIREAQDALRNTSGRVILRRLNRVEYRNTMQDLLGLEMDYDRDLPPDAPSRDGFRNDGAALRMSPLQLEYYLATARRALDRVIVSGEAPRVYEYKFDKSNVGGWLGNVERSNQLGRQQSFLATMKKDYPEEGEFLIRITIDVELKPDKGFPLLEVSVGYRPDTKILFREVDVVELDQPGRHVLEFRGRLENHPLPVRGQGKFPGLVVRARNLYTDGSPLPKGEKNKFPPEPDLPLIVVQSLEFTAPVFDAWPPPLHRNILIASELREQDELAYTREVLRRFLPRAYRRPASDLEVDALADFFQTIRPDFPSYEEAVRETLAMALIQPQFLYLLEELDETASSMSPQLAPLETLSEAEQAARDAAEPSAQRRGRRQITDWELASRLSYFLWSTMPDETLTKLAAESRLGLPEVLAEQVERMLADSRSERMVRQFTEQWLRLDTMDQVAVSQQQHPNFDDQLKPHMRGETIALMTELIRHNECALLLLDSDFTMLNEPLAKHYGIDGVLGQAFRRVPLPAEPKRGGLLGHASILLANSTGADSHAVRRAVWIRDRLLNDPPAPPPPNVPTLDEADAKFRKLSVREQLEIHRGDGACASCHRGIDPWGIALEHFDAVGKWRNEIQRRNGKQVEALPVQAADVLPDGTPLDGAVQLRQHLLTARRDDFVRSLTSRLLTYALGRRLEFSDEPVVDDLAQKLAAREHRLRDLIVEIVRSEPFRTK
ncbi:MAG: DUF1592 domain-containing protein [Planctomycetales bacterium]|nr:DUF1592 domain-containing protein [Planctomycetales bacterium]